MGFQMPSTEKINVLFIFKPSIELKNYLINGIVNYSNINLIFPDKIDDENLLKYTSKADIMIGWRPFEELLLKAEDLKIFINPGVGIQHHIEPFRKLNKIRNVVLVNGHGNTYFTAQHAVALLLSLTNRVVLHHNWMHKGKWRMGDKQAASIPLRNRKIGLLGYGYVNQKVHKMLSGFNVEFSAIRNNWKKDTPIFPTALQKYYPNQMYDFLNKIDILIIAIPLTSKTEGLITLKELRLLGENGLLVNVSRGKIINEADLYTSLKDKIIKGAAIDVWYDYHPKSDKEGRKYPFSYPYHELENIILSPHRAASPFDDLNRWDEVIENLIRFSKGNIDLINVVDLEREY